MNYRFKKFLTACLIASLAVSAFGCGNKSGETSNSSAEDATRETISLDQTKVPLTFEHETGPVAEATENTAAQEDGSAAAAEPVFAVPVTEIVKVTEEGGQPVTDAKGQEQTEIVKVTEVVKVTEAGGQPVTDAKGQPETKVVDVTETAAATQPVNSGTTAPTASADNPEPATLSPEANPSKYQPSYDTCKAYWLDMSQESDFFFEGEFLIIEFQINADTPDGVYPVTIAATDIASWDLVAWTPDIINGEVGVNQEVQPQAEPDEDFTLKVRSISGNRGDILKVAIDLSHNPGFCGFTLDVQYDKNAMTIVDTYGGADFLNTAVNYLAN